MRGGSRNSAPKLLAACCGFALWVSGTAFSEHGLNQEAVVVHAGLGMQRLELPTLRAIFGMRLLEWPDGTPIRVFVMKSDSELHQRFTKSTLQIFPYQLQQAWDRLVFSGTGQAPREVQSIEEMQRRISETPGAIGYLPWNRLTDRLAAVEVVAR